MLSILYVHEILICKVSR